MVVKGTWLPPVTIPAVPTVPESVMAGAPGEKLAPREGAVDKVTQLLHVFLSLTSVLVLKKLHHVLVRSGWRFWIGLPEKIIY